jgi:hypothetical protein
MAITSGDFAKGLWPGLNSIFNDTYNEYPLECMEIFDSVNSNKAYEERLGFSGLGLAKVKPEGSSVSYDTMQQGFVQRTTNVVYALGYVITREARDDNQYAALGAARSKALARSMKQTKEIVAANILNRAFNNQYTGADGKELCSDQHVTKNGLTYQNELTTAADLSEATLEQMCIDIADLEDERGLKIAVMPRKLVIPRQLMFEAERILKSTLQNDTANNAINALKTKGVLREGYTVNHFLTDANNFWILTDIRGEDGLIMQKRTGLEFSNDTDFNSDNMKFKAYERYAFDWVDPRCIYGSAPA